LAIKHKATGDRIDDMELSSWLEYAAFAYIFEYCEKQGLMVEGFPHEKRKLAKRMKSLMRTISAKNVSCYMLIPCHFKMKR
jgi:hypothetical protein